MILTVGGKDLSEVAEKITWSGDTKQVARKLSFTIAKKDSDFYLPKVTLQEGDSVFFEDENKKPLFGGILFDIDKTGSASVVSYLAFDFMFYINNSDISKIFSATPEVITSEVCTELGVPFGGAAATGIAVYVPCLGKKAYEAIMMAYTAASRQNGKKYIPLIKNTNQLFVIEKGAYSGVALTGDYNLTESSYNSSLQPLVNKVLITDKSGNVVSIVQDAASMQKYGTVQRVYKKEDGKDAQSEAKVLLQGIEQSGGITALSDKRAVSGYSVAIQEPISGLYGKFFVESDTHTFENGMATMQLTVAFSNMMDEKEIEKTET